MIEVQRPEVRLRPLVRYHQAPTGIIWADWSCDLCWPQTTQAIGARVDMMAAACQHYQDVHVAGLERVLAAIRDLDGDQCSAVNGGARCQGPNGHDGPHADVGSSWDDEQPEPCGCTPIWGEIELGCPTHDQSRPVSEKGVDSHVTGGGREPGWSGSTLLSPPSGPRRQVPWGTVALATLAAVTVAAVVLLLTDVLPWGLGILPW